MLPGIGGIEGGAAVEMVIAYISYDIDYQIL